MSNFFSITGNLTADPELRFTSGGDAVANFTVADTPRKFNKQTNEWEDAGETLFVRASIWREDAEAAAEGLKRGQKVTVTGKLKQRSYDKDGQKRVVYEMDAESVSGHAKRADRSGGYANAGAPAAQGGGDAWATNGNGGGGWASTEPPF